MSTTHVCLVSDFALYIGSSCGSYQDFLYLEVPRDGSTQSGQTAWVYLTLSKRRGFQSLLLVLRSVGLGSEDVLTVCDTYITLDCLSLIS